MTFNKEIAATLRQISLASLGGDINGWVSEKIFSEKTGIDTPDKLYKFRKENPELVKNKPGTKTYTYHLQGYFDQFQ